MSILSIYVLVGLMGAALLIVSTLCLYGAKKGLGTFGKILVYPVVSLSVMAACWYYFDMTVVMILTVFVFLMLSSERKVLWKAVLMAAISGCLLFVVQTNRIMNDSELARRIEARAQAKQEQARSEDLRRLLELQRQHRRIEPLPIQWDEPVKVLVNGIEILVPVPEGFELTYQVTGNGVDSVIDVFWKNKLTGKALSEHFQLVLIDKGMHLNDISLYDAWNDQCAKIAKNLMDVNKKAGGDPAENIQYKLLQFTGNSMIFFAQSRLVVAGEERLAYRSFIAPVILNGFCFSIDACIVSNKPDQYEEIDDNHYISLINMLTELNLVKLTSFEIPFG